MNEEQKAGLVLHELIYREAIKAVHSTSHPTRYLNGYLSSALPKRETYAHIVSQMPLEWVEYGGGMILKIGVVFCGAFGAPGCAFQRKTDLNADGSFIDGEITEIFDNVETEDVKIDFNGFKRKMDLETSKFRFQSGKSILLSMGRSTEGGGKRFSLKEIYASKLLYLSFTNEFEKENEFKFSYLEMNHNVLYAGHGNPITLDPNSWVMNSNNIVIENIKSLDRGGRDIQDLSGRVWILDTLANIYR